MKDYKEKLVNLEFDFTSLHEFLNNTRFVMNQHAKLLNELRKDAVTRCLIKEISTFFVGMARSYPIDTVNTNMDQMAKTTTGDSKDTNMSKIRSAMPSQSRIGRQESFFSASKNSQASQKMSIVGSPRKILPNKHLSSKESLKDSVEKFNLCIKHIADQLVVISKTITRGNQRHESLKCDVDRKLYKREFENIFNALSKKLNSQLDVKVDHYDKIIERLEKGKLPS